MINNFWDEVMAGPQPEETGGGRRRLERLRKNLSIQTNSGVGEEGSSGKTQMSPAAVAVPVSPTTPSPTAARKENVWRSVFHPGSNLATRRIGNEVFDKPAHPNSPTIYDWMYSEESRSKHR